MRKSGLHKQIASIFDGAPCGTDGQDAEAPAESSATSVLKRLYGGFDEDVTQTAAAQTAATVTVSTNAACAGAKDTAPAVEKAAPAGETAGHPDGAGAQVQSATPAAATGRPMPLARVKSLPRRKPQGPSLSQQVQKKLFGNSGADPHQKKMAILAGGLAVVFGAVLFLSLGGVGGGRVSPDGSDSQTDQTRETVSSGPAWTMPQALAATMRDPMKPAVAVKIRAEEPTASSRAFVVKGIVFGRTHSSALIDNEIVREGQEFNGIKVVRINQTEVEFEADGRRWTQPVRP